MTWHLWTAAPTVDDVHGLNAELRASLDALIAVDGVNVAPRAYAEVWLIEAGRRRRVDDTVATTIAGPAMQFDPDVVGQWTAGSPLLVHLSLRLEIDGRAATAQVQRLCETDDDDVLVEIGAVDGYVEANDEPDEAHVARAWAANLGAEAARD